MSRRYKPKARLATRIDPVVAGWLESVAQREGWTITDATEWALSGVRHLEHRLGARLEPLLDEQRAGGESLFVTLGRRLESTFSPADPQSTAAPIVPTQRSKTRAA
jgi:hypothetical protein